MADVSDAPLACICQGLLEGKLLKPGDGAVHSPWWEFVPTADVTDSPFRYTCRELLKVKCLESGHGAMHSHFI